MRHTLPALIFLVLAVFASAQVANTPKDGLIAGSVVDAVSGQAIAGAQVFVRGVMPSPGSGNIGQPAVTTTDINGEFHVENLGPGRYVLRAVHTGYVDRSRRNAGGAAKPVALSSGQHVDGLVLSLTPGGAVSGHITDEAGNAVAGASIALMKSSYNAGKREANETATATTEEDGQFRFTGLAPGRYYLRATSPPARHGKTADNQAYVPLYYPHATEQATAAPLDVQPGEELGGIDLSFAPVHSVRIAGQVVDARTSLPTKGASVTLLSDHGNTTFPSGEMVADVKGGFEFRGVPQGSYVVVAQSSSLKDQDKTVWGRASVDVFDVDVTSVKIPISRGVDVSGRIRVEGKGAADAGKLSVSLESRDGPALIELLPDIESANVGPDGSYVFRDVPEGSYDISFEPLPAGYYLKATNGGDAVESVTIGRGHASSIPEITLSPATAWVAGTVSSDNQPSVGASVVLVPTGKRQHQSHYYKTAVSDRMGRFTLRGVAPGDYRLFAWEEIEKDAYMDADFLRNYEDRGQTVRVEDSAVTGLQVEVISASEMQ